MRPRVFPAEDAGIIVALAYVLVGFNEAAGIPRGRHLAGSVCHSAGTSSLQ